MLSKHCKCGISMAIIVPIATDAKQPQDSLRRISLLLSGFLDTSLQCLLEQFLHPLNRKVFGQGRQNIQPLGLSTCVRRIQVFPLLSTHQDDCGVNTSFNQLPHKFHVKGSSSLPPLRLPVVLRLAQPDWCGSWPDSLPATISQYMESLIISPYYYLVVSGC